MSVSNLYVLLVTSFDAKKDAKKTMNVLPVDTV